MTLGVQAWVAGALVGAALLTAILSGVIGMGGGVTLLGVMTTALPPTWVVPLHAVVQLLSNSTRTLVFLRKVRWSIFAVYVGPMAGGVFLGTLAWQPTQAAYLRPGVGIFILVFLLLRRFATRLPLGALPWWTFAPVGLVVGFLTLFFGATGPFVAPFFLRDDLSKEEIVATKAVCQSVGHALKVPAFLSLSFDFMPHLPLVAAMGIAVIGGTLIGKALLRRISRAFFLSLFEIVLALLALWLLTGPLLG